MKAIYNQSESRLIAYKGDTEPIQFYANGQLIDNISAVPRYEPGAPGVAESYIEYISDYKNNLSHLRLFGNSFQKNYLGRNKFNVGEWVELIETEKRPNGAQLAIGEFVEYDGRNCFKLTDCAYSTLWFYLPEGVHGLRFSALTSGGTYTSSFAQIRYADGTTSYIGVGSTSQRDVWRDLSYYNTGKTIERFGLFFSPTDGTTVYIDIDSIMAEESAIQTEYEPYVGGIPSPNADYPQKIVNAENLSVQLSGANLTSHTVHIPNEIDLDGTLVSLRFAKYKNADYLTINNATKKVYYYQYSTEGEPTKTLEEQSENIPPIEYDLTNTDLGKSLLEFCAKTKNQTNIITAKADSPYLTAFDLTYMKWGGRNAN